MENKEQRTFETRLKFINGIFSNKYSRTAIMTSCINFKLRNSLNNYIEEMDKSLNALENANLMSVMKKMK